MEKSTFDELRTTGKLPSPSGVALRIMELSRQDDVGLDEIARVVQADPALSGRLIKFANSALSGPRRPIAAVQDAIRLLGLKTVRQLALGFSIMGQHRAGACNAFDYGAFWSGSLAAAIASKTLCLRTRSAPPDEAFTCGLLQNIGALALATLYPDGYGAIILDRPEDGRSLRQREREHLHTDHLELTVALLEEWMLPRVFVNAVACHEDPDDGEYPEGSRQATLCHLLHLARNIGLYCGADDPARRDMLPDLIFHGARIGLDSEALALLIDQVVAEWREWGTILEVRTTDIPAFNNLLQASKDAVHALPVPGNTLPQDGGVQSAQVIPLNSRAEDAMRILVVDDDRTILALVSRVLSDQGHQVSTANNGHEALRVAMREQPQMIVCDWIMPEMDGLGFCRALRETEEGRQMYFLLLTAREDEDNLVEAFEAGVDDFVTKPVSPRVLLARLRAGQRVVRLQQESMRDAQSLRRFATELAVANRRLRQAALTDPLTGLPNRRYAMERLEQEWAASRRSQRTFTLMMVDIDRFKAVNDAHGHEVGDQVLRQIALALRKAARSEDVICRLGGEEFLVISPDTPLTPALRLADRLRQAVCGSPMTMGTLRFPLSVSIGVAERGPGMTKYDELLKAADEVLYHAKRLGGNRVQASGLGATQTTPNGTNQS
ncbi:MAG: HDOD domain-containing protein [Betaproteobacteria bacterium]|nr:HDOD domain-containing protein [Betaproteobacteria bacterium]